METTKRDPKVDRVAAYVKQIEDKQMEDYLRQSKRDPRVDPQPGDKIYQFSKSYKRLSRRVVSRIDNNIIYLNHDGKKKTCWISAWMDWARIAEVE